MKASLSVSLLVVLAACGGGTDADAGVDTGVDTGAVDTGAVDAGPTDAGTTDAGPMDAGPTDGGPSDLGVDMRGAIGSPCAMASDCIVHDPDAGALCLVSMPGAFYPDLPGGYCSVNCIGFTSSVCGPGAVCEPFPSMGPRCWKACTTDGDCRATEGYHCMLDPFFPDASVCLPPLDAGVDGG